MSGLLLGQALAPTEEEDMTDLECRLIGLIVGYGVGLWALTQGWM